MHLQPRGAEKNLKKYIIKADLQYLQNIKTNRVAKYRTFEKIKSVELRKASRIQVRKSQIFFAH